MLQNHLLHIELQLSGSNSSGSEVTVSWCLCGYRPNISIPGWPSHCAVQRRSIVHGTVLKSALLVRIGVKCIW